MIEERSGLAIMRPEVLVAENRHEAAAKAAEFFACCALREVSNKGIFTAALSGGKTPRQMHKMLGSTPFSERIPWDKTHIFLVDERMVPSDHPESNYGAARNDLFSRIALPAENIHSVDTGLQPARAAQSYDRKLSLFFEALGLSEPAVDLVMLGMGADGHTASLLPNGEVLCTFPWVWAVRGGDPFLERVTMSLASINNARICAFLVTGKEKAWAAAGVIKGEAPELPAARVRPRERLVWFLDRDAAGAGS